MDEHAFPPTGFLWLGLAVRYNIYTDVVGQLRIRTFAMTSATARARGKELAD